MIMLALVMAMAAPPAQALEYNVDEPDEGMFAPSSSVEQMIVVGAALRNRAILTAAKMRPLRRLPLEVPTHTSPELVRS